MADVDIIEFPDGTQHTIVDSEARANMENTEAAGSLYHLGFYLDENGGLCQVNSI
jgi:hypothetical protein